MVGYIKPLNADALKFCEAPARGRILPIKLTPLDTNKHKRLFVLKSIVYGSVWCQTTALSAAKEGTLRAAPSQLLFGVYLGV